MIIVQLISNLMLACTNSRANNLFSLSPLSRLTCSIPLLASVPSRACVHEQTRSSLTSMQARVLTAREFFVYKITCIKFSSKLVILVKTRSISSNCTKIVIQTSGNVKVKTCDLILESRKKLIALYSGGCTASSKLSLIYYLGLTRLKLC